MTLGSNLGGGGSTAGRVGFRVRQARGPARPSAITAAASAARHRCVMVRPLLLVRRQDRRSRPTAGRPLPCGGPLVPPWLPVRKRGRLCHADCPVSSPVRSCRGRGLPDLSRGGDGGRGTGGCQYLDPGGPARDNCLEI